MKKLLYIFVFIAAFLLGSCEYSFSQDISLPRETAEKALKAIELNPKLEAENAELRKLVTELEAAKLTPCVIAINAFTTEFLKLPMPSADNSKVQNKAIIRQRDQIHAIWKKSIQAQCNWQSSPKWYESLFKFLPLLALLK